MVSEIERCYTCNYELHVCSFVINKLCVLPKAVYVVMTYKTHVVKISTIVLLNSCLHYTLKMLGLYLLGQNCLHLTFEQYLSSETYSRKYEKLPNIVILACNNITEKMHLLKMSGPQIWLCLFTFRPIASKQLNGLTTIDTVS